MIHKANQPDVVVHFFDTDSLSGKDLAKIDFLFAQTEAAATGDHDGFVVERVVSTVAILFGARCLQSADRSGDCRKLDRP